MTALSLELMDITRNWVSSFVMFCQAFTAAEFSCCLFVGLSAFSFVFSKWNAWSIGLRSGDWLSLQNIPLFYLLLSFIKFAVFDLIWAESISLNTSELIQLLLSSVTSSINTSSTVPLEAMHAHAITLLHNVSQMMLYALDHELSGFSRCFWQSLIWPCLHLVANPLYLLSWSLLLIVNFDSDMSSS